MAEDGERTLTRGPSTLGPPQGIYVESRIRSDIDEVWKRTQTPDLHERWDLRFTRIEYLPRPAPNEPQKFRYATRIGFGFEIAGDGESTAASVGTNGEKTSALRFWSEDGKSLIKEGSGYWRYVPTSDGVRFLTWYTYRTRFGAPGRVFDRLGFRPLMGWATAWSFDRLRLWIEKGIDPAVSMQRSLVHAVARVTLAFLFLYHGLIPKLLSRHSEELALVSATGVPERLAPPVMMWLGIGEIVFGVALLFFWRARALFLIVIAFMVAAALTVASTMPEHLNRPFNPVTFNAAAIALALIGFLSSRDLPSASRCLRTAPAE